MIKEIKSIEENVDFDKLSFTGSNKSMTIEEAEVKQKKFTEKLDDLRAYPARESEYIDLK